MASRDQGQAVRSVLAELHALSSKMQIVAQRMKIIEKNERIIGKTLISHNKTLKELERQMGTGAGGRSAETSTASSEKVAQLELDIAQVKEEIKEIKYVIDTINPVSFVTSDEVSDLIDDKLRKAKTKAKK